MEWSFCLCQCLCQNMFMPIVSLLTGILSISENCFPPIWPFLMTLTIGINMFWHKHWHKRKLHANHQKLHSTFSRGIFFEWTQFSNHRNQDSFPPPFSQPHFGLIWIFEPAQNCQPKFDDTSGATCLFFSSPWGIVTTKTFPPGDLLGWFLQ